MLAEYRNILSLERVYFYTLPAIPPSPHPLNRYSMHKYRYNMKKSMNLIVSAVSGPQGHESSNSAQLLTCMPNLISGRRVIKNAIFCPTHM